MDSMGHIANPEKCDIVSSEQDDLKDFLLVLRRALMMIISFIEKRYRIETK